MLSKLPDTLIEDRFLGCILGQAVGNALGLPFEGFEPERIAEVFPTPDQLGLHHLPIRNYRLGQYSDDTQMMRCVLESLVANADLLPADIAQRLVLLWETEVIGAGDACSIAIGNLRRGIHWQESGAPVGQAGNGTAMRVAPLGLWYHQDLDLLVEQTKQLSLITHKDERSTAGAIAIAVTVAYLVTHKPQKSLNPVTLADVLFTYISPIHPTFAEEISHFPQRLSLTPSQALREIRRAGYSTDKHTPWPGISGYIIPTVLAVLDAFARSPKNFRQSLWQVLMYGGDVDTTGAITGALSGAFNGLSQIPDEWAKQVHDVGQKGYDYLRSHGIKLHRLKSELPGPNRF